MSTRSFIGRFNADGTVTGHYCHSDGYYSHNGRILNDHYNDPDKIGQLISLGMQSVLAENIGVAHDFEWRSKAHGAIEDQWDKLSASEREKYKDKEGNTNKWVFVYSRLGEYPEHSMCLFYGRDRGESDTKPTTTELEDCDFQEYQYIYDPFLKVWFCSGGRDREWRILPEVMMELEGAEEGAEYEKLYSRTMNINGRISQLKQEHEKTSEVEDLAAELTAKEPEWA